MLKAEHCWEYFGFYGSGVLDRLNLRCDTLANVRAWRLANHWTLLPTVSALIPPGNFVEPWINLFSDLDIKHSSNLA